MTIRTFRLSRSTKIGAVLITASLAWAAVLFANSEGTAAVAEDAAVQVRAQGMIGAVAVSRAIISEALVFGVAHENDQISEATLMAVLDDAEAVLADLASRQAALTDLLEDSRIEQALDDYSAAANTLLSSLGTGDIETAQSSDAATLRLGFDRAIELLVAERDGREREIAAIRTGVADVANAARFVVAFFLPILAVIWVLVVIRQRQRRLQAAADIALEEALRSAKDEFLSAVAHELRTPLTAVVGFAETLRDQTRHFSATDRAELVEILADQATHTAAIVEDLLVFARANVGDLMVRTESVKTRDLIEKVTATLVSVSPNRLKIAGDATVLADPRRLRQVIRNLVSNAFDHGGQNVEVRLRQTGPRVTIEVADDGIGIPPEARSAIFEPFLLGARREGQPANIGLGLTVARSLVRLMDGELDYYYRAGESVFQVTLPAAGSGVNGHREGPVLSTQSPSAAQVLDVLANQRFEIVYQPIVDLQNPQQQVIGYEALTRFPRGSPPDWFAMAAIAGVGLDLQLATIRAAIRLSRDARQPVSSGERVDGHVDFTSVGKCT